MALNINDLLVVSKSSDGSLAKVTVETLLQQIGIGAVEELSFGFCTPGLVVKNSTDNHTVTFTSIHIGEQPVNETYKWYQYDTFQGGPETATEIPTIVGYPNYDVNNAAFTGNMINCEATSTFADGTVRIFKSSSWVEASTGADLENRIGLTSYTIGRNSTETIYAWGAWVEEENIGNFFNSMVVTKEPAHIDYEWYSYDSTTQTEADAVLVIWEPVSQATTTWSRNYFTFTQDELSSIFPANHDRVAAELVLRYRDNSVERKRTAYARVT